jgi:hypothetical protein
VARPFRHGPNQGRVFPEQAACRVLQLRSPPELKPVSPPAPGGAPWGPSPRHLTVLAEAGEQRCEYRSPAGLRAPCSACLRAGKLHRAGLARWHLAVRAAVVPMGARERLDGVHSRSGRGRPVGAAPADRAQGHRIVPERMRYPAQLRQARHAARWPLGVRRWAVGMRDCHLLRRPAVSR